MPEKAGTARAFSGGAHAGSAATVSSKVRRNSSTRYGLIK